MKFRHLSGLVLIVATVLLAGCPKGSQEYNAGEKAESLKDYDTALDYYNKALQASAQQHRIPAEGGSGAL